MMRRRQLGESHSKSIEITTVPLDKIHQREMPTIEDTMMPLACDDETPVLPAWKEPQQSIEITTVPLDMIPVMIHQSSWIEMETPQQAVDDTMSCDETPILSPSAARQVTSVSLSASDDSE